MWIFEMWNPPNVYITNFKIKNDKNMKINQNMTVGWNWPMSGLQVFARLNYVMYERKPIPALVRWACLVEFLRQTASDHVGWREWTEITNFFPLWEAPCLPLYLLCLELLSRRETPELFLWGQWRVCSGKTRESFEAFPTAELGEGKKEKDKDPCIGTPYLRGNLLRITIPSSHHPPMWHYTVEGLSYTKSHLPAELPMPPISPGNRTAHISSTVPCVLEVGKTSQEVPWRVSRHWFCWDIARMGFLEAADLHLVKHGQGDRGGIPVVSGRGWEKRGQSSIPHALERNLRLNPLLLLFCKDARHSPGGWRAVRGVQYLGRASFHFSG